MPEFSNCPVSRRDILPRAVDQTDYALVSRSGARLRWTLPALTTSSLENKLINGDNVPVQLPTRVITRCLIS